jgi:hypothetical protein
MEEKTMNSFLGFNFSFSKEFPEVADGGKDYQLSFDGFNTEGQKLGTLELRLKTKEGDDLAFVAAAKWNNQDDQPANKKIASFVPPESATGYFKQLKELQPYQGIGGEMFIEGYLLGLGKFTKEQAEASAKLFVKLLDNIDFETGSINTSNHLSATMLTILFDDSWISVSFNVSPTFIKEKFKSFSKALGGEKEKLSFANESDKDYAISEEEE